MLLYLIHPPDGRSLLRCPIKSSGLHFSSILSTAATRSPPSPCHRQRSARSPVAFIYIYLLILQITLRVCKHAEIIPHKTKMNLLLLYRKDRFIFFNSSTVIRCLIDTFIVLMNNITVNDYVFKSIHILNKQRQGRILAL